MFDPVDPKQRLPEMENGILQYWKEEDIFKRSIKQRWKGSGDLLDGKPGTGEDYSFYDGPPFATGLPHYGHLLAGTIKDVIPRYQTMRGKCVQRRFGWDCHGLPVENLVEKENNIKDKNQIEEMGVAAFNELCRSSVQRYTREWRQVVERMGRWVDMDWDYRTMDPEYMESIWWVVHELQKKKLLYQGHRPMHVCPRCVTPLSNFEVTQGYKDVTDLSVYVKLELEDEPGTSLLVWTTTTWTLPGNVLAAVHPNVSYAQVRVGDERLIVAHDRLEAVFGKDGYEIEKKLSAKELVGRHYKPLFPYFVETLKNHDAFRVVSAPYVTTDSGTGLVHLAPAFGEEDFYLGQKEKIPLVQHVSMDGKFIAAVTDFAGQDAKPLDDPTKNDRKIADHLKAKGLLFKSDNIRHSYPHYWRCDSPLLNYATSSWFVKVEDIKEKLLKNNAKTSWVPGHLRDGRFGKWLENARDWAVSRNRYWGTPLPIWMDENGDTEILSSRDDLLRVAPQRFTKVTFLRHGESEGNLIPVYQGTPPGTALTKTGRAQAKVAADQLQKQNVKAVYASPLTRAQQTAAIVTEQAGGEVVTDERLREVQFGEYEGKTVDFDDLAFVKARRAHKLKESSPESIYHFPGMETWDQVQDRLSAFLREVLPRHRGEHIVIVTHADVVQNARHFFGREEPMKISHQPYPRYAEPFVFYWDHERNAQMDLHKDTVDDIVFPGPETKKSVKVTLVRHGETDNNKKNIVQGGDLDAPLNATGREQAKELAAVLKKQKFDVILCSDLSRAAETAEILAAALGLPVSERIPAFNERNLRPWSGMTFEEFNAAHPQGFPEMNPVFHFETPEEGESLDAFIRRVRGGCDAVLERYAGKRVLLVSHRGTMEALDIIMNAATYREACSNKPGNTETRQGVISAPFRRIPEVLDCWFESGSMPYAQSHYPFSSNGKTLPPGFPADFIAEGVDQTRGWFYTLAVLATALFDKPAFTNCVVNGIVLAEDGKKMSKRLKNYPEPTEIVEKYGADAIRFTLMRSPAVRGEDLRMSEKLVEETVRQVLLPLWNTYSFFVTYANAAGYEAVESRRASVNPLDQWIRTEVQDLVNRMTNELDRYDLSATCAELQDTIDALTNWYIRLSRRRFAGKAERGGASEVTGIDSRDDDQLDALNTLHDVLLTISQLLAPFCPFITEAIYLNLVSQAHGSIHLTDWPLVRKLTREEDTMIRKTRLMRTIVSLGLSVRSDQKIKVRCPLAAATVAVPPSLAEITLSGEDRKVLAEELNVKEITFVEDPGALATAVAMVDARKTGPRFGARVQDIIRAGKAGDFTVREDGIVLILDEELGPEEVQIVYRGSEGQNVAADRGVVVSLDTTVTPELEREGLARDIIRGIQKLRKEAGLSFTDEISLELSGMDDVTKEHGAMIARETRSVLEKNTGEEHTIDLEGHKVTVRFIKR
jgi:isoleucyl-tRNA synthetase